jgi:hypothetical protein
MNARRLPKCSKLTRIIHAILRGAIPSGSEMRAASMLMTRLARQIGSVVVVALTIVGCSQNVTPPTAPPAADSPAPAPPAPPTPTGPGLLWGFVVEDSGVCISDAIVEIVRGTGSGQSAKQTTPCSAWDYDRGFLFKDLIAGTELTVRASAPGYRTAEQTFMASSASGYTSVGIVLTRIQ